MHNASLKSTYALLYVVQEQEPSASDLRQADSKADPTFWKLKSPIKTIS